MIFTATRPALGALPIMIESVATSPSRARLHWTRIVLIAGAVLGLVSTFLPWLVGVPPNVLDLGSGTILGITTIHGMIACGAMLAIIVLALLRPQQLRPSRGILAAMLGLAVVALGISSLVLGTTKATIFEEIEKHAPNRQTAERAIGALADQLRGMDMGTGGVVLFLACGLLVLTGLAAMFVKRPA